NLKSGCKVKCASLSHLTFYPDMPSHQFNQLPGNSESKPSSTIFACDRGVGLGKTIENSVQFFGRDTDACIGNREKKGASLLSSSIILNAQYHFSFFSELDSIAYKIEENLA